MSNSHGSFGVDFDLNTTFKILSTARFNRDSFNVPFLTASIIFSSALRSGPGIWRSKLPCIEATGSCTAPQSLTTNPWKFHSSRKISWRIL